MKCTICHNWQDVSADDTLDLCSRCYTALHRSYNQDPVLLHDVQNRPESLAALAAESED